MKKQLLATAVASAMVPVAAHAAYLDGTNVTLRYQLGSFPDTADPLVVGAGTEITCAGSPPPAVCAYLNIPTQTIDFTDTSISYLYTNPGSSVGFTTIDPNRFIFDDLDEPGFELSGATITSPVDFTGRLSFDAKSVTLNMAGLTFASGQGFTLNLTFRNLNLAPAPGTAWLAGLALAGLAVRRRRAG